MSQTSASSASPTPYALALRRLLVGTSWFFAVGPGVLFVALVTFGLHVHAVLGRWPVAYRDTPTSELLAVHETAFVFPALLLAAYSIPGWFLAGVLSCAGGITPRRTLARQATVLLVCAAILILAIRFDPTGYIEWFLD